MRHILVSILVAGAPLSAGATPVDEPPNTVMESYALQAGLIDAAVLTGGMVATLAWPDTHPSPSKHGVNYGAVLMGVGAMTGGMLTHGLYGNDDARWRSVGLRAQSTGVGALYGLGGGAVVGSGLGLVCVGAGGGYCPLAIVYGLVLGPVIGATAGFGVGLHKDYSRLARRPTLVDGDEASPLKPTMNVTPEGDLQFGISGAF